MSNVVLKNVVKKFAGVTAVDHLDVEIQDQEFAILVGPSGCGKTTALRMIAGLEEVTSGDIYIDGRPVKDVAPKDRDIAMVFQNYALYPHKSVRDNIGFGLKMRNFSRQQIEISVGEAAAMLGIEELLDRMPKQLSGGQRQRVALGRAIVRNPKVFLFDEPLSNLDAKMRVAMRAEISKLHRQLKATIIYVTHDQVEAMTMASRIFVMNKGRLQQSDAPTNVYADPANLFVAGFIGSPAMNFIEAAVLPCEKGIGLSSEGLNVSITNPTDALRGRIGSRVILGIRPEDLSPVPSDDTESDCVLTGRVEMAETLGSEVLVYLACGKISIVVKMNARSKPFATGQVARFRLDMATARIFDPTTTLAIR